MRANAWRKYLEEQRERYGKVLFTVTELANVSCASPTALNVELARLRGQEVIVRYAHGLYGMPRAVSPQILVPAIDSHAYITGHFALYGNQMVTQMPVTITCFTNRRSPRAQERVTPVGRLVFRLCAEQRILAGARRSDCDSGTSALRLRLSFASPRSRSGSLGYVSKSRADSGCQSFSDSREVPR